MQFIIDIFQAREHLQILSKLKHSAKNITEKEIEQRLEDVRLLKVADNRSTTFSGGMKRRLSVAISTIGNPKIIFMDEPTTGMDPRNRRYVWNLIQKIKHDKLIILTTYG
jgi:ABC-type multidrug transport system ATPase subunit